MSTRLDSVTDWVEVARLAHYKCENIAGTYLISDRHLERFFHSRFNRSPKQWMQALRMKEAEVLIKRGYSTKAAAQELFYQGPSQFCREFKKYFGKSPQHFASISTCPVPSTMSDSANQLELSAFNTRFKIPFNEPGETRPLPAKASHKVSEPIRK